MLTQTSFRAPLSNIDIFGEPGKHDLTQQTGDFFYDPCELKQEYKDTVWEEIWCSLPGDTGQARIIVLESPSCYTQHADIDDRYHLNLFGDESYLIDLENTQMYKLVQDSIWYEMDAGRLHSAINIGEHMRMQLVVRKLLKQNVLTNPTEVTISAAGNNPRYHFDNKLSPWLNRANKRGIINSFQRDGGTVYFNIEHNCIFELQNIMPKEFIFEY
jgi:hypothetical protein